MFIGQIVNSNESVFNFHFCLSLATYGLLKINVLFFLLNDSLNEFVIKAHFYMYTVILILLRVYIIDFKTETEHVYN